MKTRDYKVPLTENLLYLLGCLLLIVAVGMFAVTLDSSDSLGVALASGASVGLSGLLVLAFLISSSGRAGRRITPGS
jgi:hypothetical protein